MKVFIKCSQLMLVLLVCGGISQALYDYVGWILGLLGFVLTGMLLIFVGNDGHWPE